MIELTWRGKLPVVQKEGGGDRPLISLPNPPQTPLAAGLPEFGFRTREERPRLSVHGFRPAPVPPAGLPFGFGAGLGWTFGRD